MPDRPPPPGYDETELLPITPVWESPNATRLVAVSPAELSRLQRIELAAANYVYTDAGDPAIADRYVELEAALNGEAP
jgi:hypothetical protein